MVRRMAGEGRAGSRSRGLGSATASVNRVSREGGYNAGGSGGGFGGSSGGSSGGGSGGYSSPGGDDPWAGGGSGSDAPPF